MEQTNDRRRTIGKHAGSSKVVTPALSSSIAAFLFGAPKVVETAVPSKIRTKTHVSHASSGKARRELVRSSSGTSHSSAASKASVSSKGSDGGSGKDSSSPRPLSLKLKSSTDLQEQEESLAFAVSMQLGMWESGSCSRGGTPVNRTTPSSKAKRSLRRDNSSGSNVSNISNISNNSNISILSTSSTGSNSNSKSALPAPSQGSVHSPSPGPYDPAAAAAASRHRFLATAASKENHRYPQILVREPSWGSTATASSSSASSSAAFAEEKESHRHSTGSRSSGNSIPVRPPSLPASQDTSLRSLASHELLASSAEPSPAGTPRSGSPQVQREDEAAASKLQGEPQREAKSTIEVAAKHSPTAGTAVPVLSSTTSSTVPAAPAAPAAATVFASTPAKMRRSMSPLVSRREGVERARNSWLERVSAAAAEKKLGGGAEEHEQSRPRLVKFTSSTKSMGELRAKRLREEAEARGKEGADADGKEGPLVQGAMAEVSLEIEGAIEVEDEVEVEVEMQGEGEGIGAGDNSRQGQEGSVVGAAEEAGDADASSQVGRENHSEVPQQIQQHDEAPRQEKQGEGNTIRGAEDTREEGSLGQPLGQPAEDLSHEPIVNIGTGDYPPNPSSGNESRLPSALEHAANAQTRSPTSSPFRTADSSFSSPTPSSTVAVATSNPSAASPAADFPSSSASASASECLPLSELVQRRASKDYRGLVSTELERYLSDADFAAAFKMSRSEFHALPLWKRNYIKRRAGLF